METVSELDKLLANMKPRLREGEYYLSSIDESQMLLVAGYLDEIVDIFREAEGLSIVFSAKILEEMEQMSKSPPAGPFAWISLDVYSDLMAVGFLAKITEVLAREKISVNAFSAFHHDHLFVPYGKRMDAMNLLGALVQSHKLP